MESKGAQVKKIRLEKGISLEEAHKKTKIHLNILKAIEEDTLVNFNPVYIRGFLKIYCKFLGLDPKDYLTDYKQPRIKLEPTAAVIEKQAVSKFKAPTLKFDFVKAINAKIIKKALLFIIIFAFIVGLFNLGKSISLRRFFSSNKRAPAVVISKIEKRIESPKPQKARSIAAVKAEEHKENAVKTTSSISGVRLTIRARENCRIEVSSDGKTMFKGILLKGRSETWQAKEKIELLLGNAGVVELQANDKFFSSLGKKGQPIKNIVITKEGLTIGR